MKCGSCGAPLIETSGRDRMTCSFCGTIQLVNRSTASVDNIVFLELQGEHSCPACDVPLQGALANESQVEMCRQCDGILFDRDTFVEVVWQRRSEYSGSDEVPVPVNSQELVERRKCPSCRRTFDTHPYYGPGNAVIDTCGRCDLVWLDAGELTTLERAPGQRHITRS